LHIRIKQALGGIVFRSKGTANDSIFTRGNKMQYGSQSLLDFVAFPYLRSRMNSEFALNALGPLDGRYSHIANTLSPHFSEAALIKWRCIVEVRYLVALCELNPAGFTPLNNEKAEALYNRIQSISTADLLRIKSLEKETNHDVKAVEYFLREVFQSLEMSEYIPLIHFGLTSQDVNHTAVPLMVKSAETDVLFPALHNLIALLEEKAEAWSALPMLAHTHGQPASPTALGKEIEVFAERLAKQTKLLKELPYECKFGGATGNFNAHCIAWPEINWPEFADIFCAERLHLLRQQTTTQIEQYDMLAARLDAWKRIAVIASDFAKDMWQYISMGYFRQLVKAGEVGSSAMPHKVNPIDFENAEGNLGLAIALLSYFPAKLPISRLQRDLTDSTVSRNLGLPYGYLLLSFHSLNRGLGKVLPNPEKMQLDLNNNPAVLAEAAQSVLRLAGHADAYERLKELTRTGESLDAEVWKTFIESLPLPEKQKEMLRSLSPEQYRGTA
jgi:adenylosuccinate lyase